MPSASPVRFGFQVHNGLNRKITTVVDGQTINLHDAADQLDRELMRCIPPELDPHDNVELRFQDGFYANGDEVYTGVNRGGPYGGVYKNSSPTVLWYLSRNHPFSSTRSRDIDPVDLMRNPDQVKNELCPIISQWITGWRKSGAR